MRSRLPLLVCALMLGAAVAFPLGVLASHQFSDVPNTNSFHADIDAIADAGVTTGCAPGKYCPKDYVTREQMAAFLNRLGALQAGKTPVVNATKLDSRDSTDFLGVGDVQIVQVGDWIRTGTSSIVIEEYVDATRATRGSAGDSVVQLRLQAPGRIDGQQYGLKSVQVCFANSPNAAVDETRVAQSQTYNALYIIMDTTNHFIGSGGCHTVSDPAPHVPLGGTTLQLFLNYSAAANANIGNVTTTWTPVD